MNVGVRTSPVLTSSAPKAELRAIGLSDLRVYPIAMSGNVFGWTADVTATEAVLDNYAAAGGNFIDTADSYAAGRSEIMIGNWMRDRRNRADMIVATKVGKSADNPGLTPAAIAAAVDASLGRLGVGYIDLLYLHIDDETVPFEETLLAIDSLISAGKVRYFGGSDHAGNRLIEARIASAQLGVAQMVAVQNQYNLMHRSEYETGLAQVAQMQQLGVMPRFALASGFLAGKYRSKSDVSKGSRAAEVTKYLGKKGNRVLAALDGVAFEQDSKPATIALAWLLTRPNVVAPVVSATSAVHVADLVAAATIRLTRHQITELDRASA